MPLLGLDVAGFFFGAEGNLILAYIDSYSLSIQLYGLYILGARGPSRGLEG